MRAQASMEFLVTYGWAIAALLIIIGWFAASTFSNPGENIPESCQSDAFGCRDAELTSFVSGATANEASFVLVNLEKNRIAIESVQVTYNDATGDCSTIRFLNGTITDGARPGDAFEVVCDFDSAIVFPVDTKAKVDFTLAHRKYNDPDGFVRESTGTIVALVKPQIAPSCQSDPGCSQEGWQCPQKDWLVYCEQTPEGCFELVDDEQCAVDEICSAVQERCVTTTTCADLGGDGCTETVAVGENMLSANPDICSDAKGNYCVQCINGFNWDGENCVSTCGDGVQAADEGCDLGKQNGQVCSPPYEGSCDYCTLSCEPVSVQGGWCGDEITNGPEECDDNNVNNLDGCTDQCTFTPCSAYGAGCTASVDKSSEIEVPGDLSCNTKELPHCVMCGSGYSWDGANCVEKCTDHPSCLAENQYICQENLRYQCQDVNGCLQPVAAFCQGGIDCQSDVCDCVESPWWGAQCQ